MQDESKQTKASLLSVLVAVSIFDTLSF